MLRRFWSDLAPRSRRHIVVAGIGFLVGAIFGDKLFVVVELAIGDPWDKLVLGIAGAAIASIVYEIATGFRRRS
jgi:hypothetical protein